MAEKNSVTKNIYIYIDRQIDRQIDSGKKDSEK